MPVGDVDIKSHTQRWLEVAADGPTTSESGVMCISRAGEIVSVKVDASGFWYVPLDTLRTVVEMLDAGDV